jgi:hypothetical protein
MGGTDRVEVLCAAHLEGPGQSRWSTCHLTAAAVAHAGKIELTARVADGSYYSRGPIWTYSFTPKNEQEAVDGVKAIAASPVDFFEYGQTTGDAAARDAIKALFPALKLKLLVDTTQGATDLAGEAITVGLGRYLAGQVEQGADITADLAVGIERYLAKAPFSFGYWAPYKRLIKLLEAKPEAATLLAVALARVDGQLQQVANVRATEQLRQFVSSAPSVVAGPDTLAYLMRRGRRWLRRLGRNDETAYVRCAGALLSAADAQGAHTKVVHRWILSDILYGRGASDSNHGHGSLSLPVGQYRYDRRWDRFPKAWNEHTDVVRGIWRGAAHNSDIQVWAFNVLKSQRQELPALRAAGLRLALMSPSKRLQAHACDQVAAKPKRLLELDAATAQVFLEFSSPRQFTAVYPTLEAHADAKSLQEAVLAYINEHGLSEIRRGAMPLNDENRSAKLLCYSLRFVRSRFSAAELYQLARYVGQTTQFKPVAQWQDTFGALPLKSLVELRLHLPELPKAVVRSIDSACKEAVAKGGGDENLAAALTLSPSHELRALGWTLLANAGDATVATVWNNLVAQAGSARGLESLIEALRVKHRIERIERHQSAAQLLSNLAIATASADPKLAESLLLRLATTGYSRQTLDALRRIVEPMPDGGWATRPAVLQKIIALDQMVTRLVWMGVGGDLPFPVAQIHVASRALAGRLVDAINSDEVKTMGAVQASYLTQALRASPSRLYQELGFAVACATSPHPELQQLVIARLESRRLVQSVYVPLAESGMPAAVAAAERYVASIKDRSALTKAVITFCDSGASSTRAIGLRFIERQRDRLDLNALLVALTEHTSPDVTAVVANFAASGAAFKRDALDQFDNRVLRTRRIGRKAKELVKRRLETLVPDAAVSIGVNQSVDDRRIQALVDMARASSLRDRDWALQQLARLALDGHSIPQVKVSTTY